MTPHTEEEEEEFVGVVRIFPQIMKKRDDLRLIVSSATLDAEVCSSHI